MLRELLLKGTSIEPATVRALRAGVSLPASFDDWFGRCTNAVPQARFATAGQAIDALSKALVVQNPPAPTKDPAAEGQAIASAKPHDLPTEKPKRAKPIFRSPGPSEDDPLPLETPIWRSSPAIVLYIALALVIAVSPFFSGVDPTSKTASRQPLLVMLWAYPSLSFVRALAVDLSTSRATRSF